MLSASLLCSVCATLLIVSVQATNSTNSLFSSPSEFILALQKQLISDSYVVNISICGALDIQNNTHWFQSLNDCNCTTNTNDTSKANHSYRCASIACQVHNYTGTWVNHTRVALETYLAVPLATYYLSFFAATTAAFLDFLFWLGLSLTAAHFTSPAFILYAPLALLFLILFLKRFIINCLALRYAWTRHTNFIIDQSGRLFVNHDDCLVERNGKAVLGREEVKVGKVILNGRLAHGIKSAHVEEWGW
ncbi:ORF7 protein [Simian hemorrhagic encephalitis virus]|uniref:ORF7 protein n=1 Tax=Simian hemorrhagic encephalitis virus TaxID=1965068 RepID=A0A0F6PT41_9NIDO|nr:ORF7 protein [Simian hemorrhagic encephalitis virus]AKC89301.1 ORF7 protein [Simian hemorrhagic encephalitis virus]